MIAFDLMIVSYLIWCILDISTLRELPSDQLEFCAIMRSTLGNLFAHGVFIFIAVFLSIEIEDSWKTSDFIVESVTNMDFSSQQ